MQAILKWIESTGQWSPWLMVAVFLAATLLIIWRLEHLSAGGLETTVLGTLVTPYVTGLGNLIFAYLLARKGGLAREVITNCLVNNVTNLTLVLGLPAIIWGLDLKPRKAAPAKKSVKAAKAAPAYQLNRLSLLFTLIAVLFFTGVTWALGADGVIGFNDGLVLVGLFLFWQCYHVFDVLKHNARQNKSFGWSLSFDLAVIGVGAYATYVSTDWLVDWISNIHSGFISVKHLGWLSGWLMVLPNAILAFYYAWTKRPEIAYTSQAGDGHICIPLCIGVYALFKPLVMPSFFQPGIFILLGATLVHFFFITVFGRLPRAAGLLLVAAYAYFLYAGLGQ